MSKRDRSIANMRSEAQRIYYQRQEIKRLEKENKQLKEVIDNIKSDIQNDIDGFITINEHGSCNDILELLETYMNILKEVE